MKSSHLQMLNYPRGANGTKILEFSCPLVGGGAQFESDETLPDYH